MSTNFKNDDSIFSNKNIYINDFLNHKTTSNLSSSESSELMKKLDNISDYLNILMDEINEIKKTAKINTNTYQMPQPNIYKSLPVYKNKEIPYYQQTSSQYNFDPDIVFR
jgi:hypothetical protein